MFIRAELSKLVCSMLLEAVTNGVTMQGSARPGSCADETIFLK